MGDVGFDFDVLLLDAVPVFVAVAKSFYTGPQYVKYLKYLVLWNIAHYTVLSSTERGAPGGTRWVPRLLDAPHGICKTTD